MIRIGIDTGGTYTDAVIVDIREDGPCVLAKAKSLTTKDDLTRGIGAAMDALPREELERVEHAAISTTLATNACVEGKGGRAKLIIVGTTQEILHRVDAKNKFGIPYEDVLTLDFEGSFDGSEVTVPDWEALCDANPVFFEEADSFGIASLYALNNGSIVERAGAQFLRDRYGKLVVEATTVAAEPNVIGRGATALLNARLVPVINEFIDAIDAAFESRGLAVPISIVRSDGTLMSEELARTRPVETILSGPAASVTGAQALAGAPESLIVDIGGTTSDISIVHDGRPNRTDGISIGGWKTQVPGVFIDTIALGGDTVVRYTKNSRLELGTRKVTPLCIAAARWPQVVDLLQDYFEHSYSLDVHARYEMLYLMRNPADQTHFTDSERQLIELLRGGPVMLSDSRLEVLGMKSERLEDQGIVMRCGMTPTDAMHLKGDFDQFDVEASRLGARCLLKSYRGKEEAEDDAQVARLADEIYDLAQMRLYSQVIGAYAQDRFWPGEPSAFEGQMKALVEASWRERSTRQGLPFAVQFTGSATLVGVGAPTHVFHGEVARALGMEGVVSDHAEVANAIGAAASRVTVEQCVRINPLRGSDGVVKGYQVAGASSAETFDVFDEAMAAAHAQAREQAIAEARRRGAQGDLMCSVEEGRHVYSSTGNMQIVRGWTVTALVE